MKKYMAIAGLVLVTVIWGGGFVASDMALDSLSPFQIMTIRFLLASVLMGGISIRNLKGIKKEEVTAGVFMGAALFIGFSLQIIGLQYTTPSKNAFLTATNVVIVPFIAFLICRKKVGFRGIIGAVLAIVGVGLLSLDKDLSLGLGDGLTLICAVGFAFQIFLTSIFVKKYRASVLNFIQMCTAGILSLIFMIASGQVHFQVTAKGWWSVLYLGIISTTVCYLLQTACQKYVDEIVTVSEDEIAAAILALLEVQKTVAEGAGATPVAAFISGKVDTSKKTVCVVSGGNVDVTTLSRVITRGLTYTGRITTITTKLADRAGSLMNLLNVVSGTGANVVRIHHEREDVNSEVNACVVSMVLETRNSEHVQQIKDKLTEKDILCWRRKRRRLNIRRKRKKENQKRRVPYQSIRTNEMKEKKKMSLLLKLIIAIVLGIVVGFVTPGMGAFGEVIIRIGATYNSIFGNFLNFVIPLIIIGFVAPGIADLGAGAGKTLAATTGVAYGSTIISGTLAFVVASLLYPHMVHAGMFMENAANAEETVLAGYFTIEMPAIMGVMTALLMAFILGLGMAVIKGNAMKTVMNEFAEIIDKLVSNIVIPLLPFHVYGIFAKLAYAGTIVEIMGSFIKVFAMILVLHWVIIVFQYTVAGSAAKKNPFALIKNMLPAYTTAIGTQSSAATIPVTTQCTKNNGVSDGMAEFVCPLCATIHLSGSTITLTSCAMAVMVMMNQSIGFGKMFPFILMLGVTMVAAPGVPGGAVMAALGILQSMLGFDETMCGLMIALYIAQDSFGTACNVTGDGAIAVFMDAITGKKKAAAK